MSSSLDCAPSPPISFLQSAANDSRHQHHSSSQVPITSMSKQPSITTAPLTTTLPAVPFTVNLPTVPLSQSQNLMITRLKAGITKPKTIFTASKSSLPTELSSVAAVLSDPN
ncbi:hypothetical protein ACOSP7_026190 [Xanthoceras sorbifolium]